MNVKPEWRIGERRRKKQKLKHEKRDKDTQTDRKHIQKNQKVKRLLVVPPGEQETSMAPTAT